MTTSLHQPLRSQAHAPGRLCRALRRSARAIGEFHAEQVHYWERYYLASRTLIPGDGPLAWVRTLDGYQLAGRYLPSPGETGLAGPGGRDAAPSPSGHGDTAPAGGPSCCRFSRRYANEITD